MPPRVTAEAHQLVSQVLTAFRVFPDNLRGKSHEERVTFLIDAGFIDKELPPEV